MKFYKYDNPFKDVPKEVFRDSLIKSGLDYEKEFADTLGHLLNLFSSYDPLHLLSVLSLYGLFRGVNEEEKRKKGDAQPLTQAHVEIAQALLLGLPKDKISYTPAQPQFIQDIWDSLIKVSTSFSQKRLVQIQQANTKQEKAVLSLQENIRQNTQYVRNWGHYRQVIDTATKMYAPLDSLYEKQHGITATNIIELIKTLISDMEIKVNEYRNRLHLVFKEKEIENVVKKYYEIFPSMKDSPQRLIEFIKVKKMPLEGVLQLILSYSDLRLPDFFTYSTKELALRCKLDKRILDGILTKLSIQPGDLKNADREHVFMDNPVWTRPFVKLSDSKYFSSIPQVFFSYIFEIMDGLIVDNEEARKKINTRRAQFLEEEIYELFQKTFPKSKIIKNFKWVESGIQYENDLIVQIDSYLIFIEAKSGRISKPALRGAPKRVKQHIEELVIEPSNQSYRLFERIKKFKTIHSEDALGKQLPFNINNIHKYIRLSVTLEQFATIQTNIMQIKKTGWLIDCLPVAPTILLADLQVIFDLLTSSEIIHYLMRRTELEGKAIYHGDELDLLGLYLETGLNIGDVEIGKTRLMLTGISKDIDDYYIALARDEHIKKPSLRITKWWSDIRRRIEQVAPHSWLEASVMLLNISPDDQLNITKNFKSIKKHVKKNWQTPEHINSAVCLPANWRDEAVALVAYREANKENRYNYMNNLADNIFSKSHVHSCLIIGVNIDRNEYPYSILSVHYRPQENA